MVTWLTKRGFRNWPWNRNNDLKEGMASDVGQLRSVIMELGREIRRAKAGLQEDGVAVSSTTATLEVEISKSHEEGGGLSFTVPAIGGISGSGKGQRSTETATKIQVVLSPEPTAATVRADSSPG